MTRHEIKASLKRAGITQQAAADKLKRTFEHQNRVLNGHRVSKDLLRRLEELIARETAEKSKEAA